MYENVFKRLIDILISLIILPFFILLYLVIALMIKKEDNGPVFYKSNRIGKDFQIFGMYKFRSMRVNAPNILNSDGSTFNDEKDPRVTKIGKTLRETSLDEIPQIVNVLKGDMSLIGPRPSMDVSLGTFKEDEKDKMKVRPGMTGYTQAYFRNNISNREKRLKDAWYSNNLSLRLDVKIALQTIKTVLKRSNLYTKETH